MAAYISVPRDLTKVKSKVAFNLTKRQLVCFGTAALIGVPLFFVLRDSGSITAIMPRAARLKFPLDLSKIRKDPQLKLGVFRYAGGGGLPRTEQQPAGLIAPLLCRVVLFDPLTRRR